jgi:hypothetical protein
VKLASDPNAIDGIKKDATVEELKVELAKRIVAVRDAGYVDLNALPPPANNERDVADASEGDEEE